MKIECTPAELLELLHLMQPELPNAAANWAGFFKPIGETAPPTDEPDGVARQELRDYVKPKPGRHKA